MSKKMLRFCLKCGQSWIVGNDPSCTCGSNIAHENANFGGAEGNYLPSYEDLKDHDSIKIKKKNHYKSQFQPWKPTYLVSTARHIDCVKAMEDHDSGAKEITFNDAICINKAMAVNAIIDEMCANG